MWTHHTRANTSEEILGAVPRANLRVCWKFAGTGGGFVAEVGRLTIADPSFMEGATLSLTTTQVEERAPMILTFRTTYGVTGLRYQEATGSLRLKIVFTHTNLIDILSTQVETMPVFAQPWDSLNPNPQAERPIDIQNDEEGDEDNVVQSTCGKLFLELWSDDVEQGFPLPKGCYYKTYPGANMRELFLLFEGMSGLRLDTTYQLVFNGQVKVPDVSDAPGGPSVHVGGSYVTIYTMDDVVSRPYEAIEMGVVSLATAPQLGPDVQEQASPRWLVPDGFKIVGGHDNLLQVHSRDAIVFEMMGHESSGKIVAQNIIRIFLWPLTQWQTTSSCNSRCLSGGEISFGCGPIEVCQGLATVANMNRNIVRIVLPDLFDPLYSIEKVRIELGGITIPAGGFFANRLAAQVSKVDDNAPHYIISSGDYIWKEPNAGQPVSKVISSAGGGNEFPFRGDEHNVLYVRLLMSSTLLARHTTGSDASLTISLPPGYTCLDMNDGSHNAWAPPDDLPVFGNSVPQGRGIPDDGTSSHGWSAAGNTCTFVPQHPFGVLYAGSSIMVEITANNPSQALQRPAPTNIWSLRMASSGKHPTYRQTTQNYPFLSSPDEFYQANLAVLGKIGEATLQPSRFERSTLRVVRQELSIFFRTEQGVGSGGTIQVHAPAGYDFEDPCTAMDLEPAYYATEANPVGATLRLPGIARCTTVGSARRQADILLTRILEGNRMFGFKLSVVNPQSFDSAQLGDWRIFTADSEGYLVDGTPATVPLAPGLPNSFGIAVESSLQVGVSITNLQPYEMRALQATATFVFTYMPIGASGAMRLTAPATFVFSDTGFIANTGSNGHTAWPGGLPVVENNGGSLVWPSTQVYPQYTYSFAVEITVPPQSPTNMVNSFIFEMGYNEVDMMSRKAANIITVPPVRALKNAAVSYRTSIITRENLLQFTLETVTTIPALGGIEITAPPGFVFEASCELTRVNDPDAPPPPNLVCRSMAAVGGGRLIRLQVPSPGSLAPGMHYFAVLAANPTSEVLNYPSNTACGTSICWFFDTYQSLIGSSPGNVPLDYGTTTQGFSIRNRMREARIIELTEEQRRATGRDDRPLQPNSIIFTFKLNVDVLQTSTEMTIRAPYGFVFPEECLPGVEVDIGSVFGEGNRFPPEYDVWPTGVTVSSCYGLRSTAVLVLNRAPGSLGIQANRLYLLRIGLTSNPLTTPSPNYWTLEYAGESSLPIDGMTLWAFTHTSIVPITTAYARSLTDADRTRNPLRIRLRPYNTLTQNGEIRAEAPTGFIFDSLPSRECSAELEELPYSELGVIYPGYNWSASGLVCLVDEGNPQRSSVRLRDTRPLTAGLDYLLKLTVFNPSAAVTEGAGLPTVWRISSYLQGGLSLDESRISAYVVNTALNTFTYAGAERNGAARQLEGSFSLVMQFPEPVAAGEMIRVQAPPDYDLSELCWQLRWIQPGISNDPTWSPLPSTTPTCTTSNITWIVQAPDAALQDFEFRFYIPLINPPETPRATVNFWRCWHYGQADSDGGRPTLSSRAFESWSIVPQLGDVQVDLVGLNQAAESISDIRVRFTPVSSAEDLLLVFNEPTGFDFSQATVAAANPPQEIFLQRGNLIRIRTAITPFNRIDIYLRNVVLGRDGGQTDINLNTSVGGMWQNGEWVPGTKRDERLHMTTGFRLPGRVIVRYDRLDNNYRRDEARYPVQSIWGVQMDRPAFAEFHFMLTRPAEVGHELRIYAPPFSPTLMTFTIVEAFTGESTGMLGASLSLASRTITKEITYRTRGELRARLTRRMAAYTIYELVLSVVCPSAVEVEAHGIPITWTIETGDGGQYPINTNDGNSREFDIVDVLGFQVFSSLAPPTADVEVTLRITPGLHPLTEIQVVAPLTFNFSANCLVFGGMDVLDCQPGREMPDGRSVATLTCKEEGITEMPENLRIRVRTPRRAPTERAWFIQAVNVWDEAQIAWGEAPGIDVEQMLDTSVVYPGVPATRGRMVWRFRSQRVVQAGGFLEIGLPAGLQPECHGDSLVPIALPDSDGCNNNDPENVIIFINSTIVPAEYAFAMYVTPPVSPPLFNRLSITLKDRHGDVRDAAVDMEGEPIQDKLRIREVPMYWTTAVAGRTSIVTLGFEALEPLPDRVVAPNQQVAEILIELPVGFTHEVNDPTDFTLVNDDMPLRDGNYLDYMQKDRLRVILQLQRTSWTTLKVGIYQFRFPVVVPSPLPIFNVWHLSLCDPNFPGGCTMRSDPAVLITFPIPGFSYGELAPGSTGMATAGATRGAVPRGLIEMVLLLLLPLLPTTLFSLVL
jgi:hypothetical protein